MSSLPRPAVVLVASLATLVTLVGGNGLAAAAHPGAPAGPTVVAPAWPRCALERIGRQLVACDNLTGSGAEAPLAVPVQRPRPTWQVLTDIAAPGCTGGCGSGSTIGPDGALYVTDGKAGRVLRVDPRTGSTTTYAAGLPRSLDAIGVGGAIDVAFLGRTAYVLVTLVGSGVGQPEAVAGLYRVERDGSGTPVVDLGGWSTAHPPRGDFSVPSGLQYALESYGNGFLVTDGHHNRVLAVTPDRRVREWLTLDNTVPTGLEHRGRRVWVAEAGPLPHLPVTGRALTLGPRDRTARVVAAGAQLAVDVELGPRRDGRRALYVLSQGRWDLPDLPENAGRPPSPDTGVLFRRDRSGTLRPVLTGLDRPTSVEFVGDAALLVTLTGRVLRIDHVG